MIHRWLRRMAVRVLGQEEARALFSEMEELYLHRVDKEGEAAAKRWRRRQDRTTLRHLLGGRP